MQSSRTPLRSPFPSLALDSDAGPHAGSPAQTRGIAVEPTPQQWLQSLFAARAIGARLAKLEPLLFAFTAAVCTLYSARVFFGARASALRVAEVARQALATADPLQALSPIPWSAPLDDVFIYFDFARSLAQGHGFQWSVGAGYSSGATSWLYPAILALAYKAGLTEFALGYFVDWFAVICVFAGLLALRRVFYRHSNWVHYLMVLAVTGQGLLSFAFWSGMEFALYFALWSAGHAIYQSHNGELRSPRPMLGLAWVGALLMATRPESLCCLLVWAALAARSCRNCAREAKLRAGLSILAPGLSLWAIRALVNRYYTGTFADAGSIAKLLSMAPYDDGLEMLGHWLSNVGFQFGRITAYHVGTNVWLGCCIWPLVGWALVSKHTRSEAVSLAGMALLWLLLVASNEYVRYQNDRYTMAPLLWVVLCGVLGLSALAHTACTAAMRQRRWVMLTTASAAISGCLTWACNQHGRYLHQAWYFGRASRNIAQQQIRMGMLLRPPSSDEHRVLVSDAGAVPYFSGLFAVDALGLGGNKGLPFAQAARMGPGSVVELIERMPPETRPDLMALYPDWWKELPLWFGARVLDVDINGNIICGARDKVLYWSRWRGLQSQAVPLAIPAGWRVVDELDIADLVSETQHDFAMSRQHTGYVIMKVLPTPQDPKLDLFDAGRLAFAGDTMTFRWAARLRATHTKLILRAAPHQAMRCELHQENGEKLTVDFEPADSWVEHSVDIATASAERRWTIQSANGECNLFHIWALQPDPDTF